ncbi:MAG TPA: phytanoyl-CoA dioxygenase family protein [Candidatus Dormibacteraeota bacterium]|nr:phytanoyl-CoA dioxygenase family protein [Candidatus Dormibacteraeota bacterium]
METLAQQQLQTIDCRSDSEWLARALETIRLVGFATISGVFDARQLAHIRESMYRAQKAIVADVGQDRLQRAGELGVLRLLCKYDQAFLDLLSTPEILAIVDATVSPTAILHLQNGFILPSFQPGEAPKVFQNRYHMDFPRVLNGYMMSINVMVAVDEFRADNGATIAIPGSHQKTQPPDLSKLEHLSVPATCPAGSLLVFDSTLYHAAGTNTSGADRLAINHQFTRSYVKQQIDYVRALGDKVVLTQPPRTQQLLGWYTRVVTSLDEYYQPSDKRLYRSGQG